MVDSDDAQEMLKRFEKWGDLPETAKDTDDVLRKFVLWTGKPISPRQQTLLRNYAKSLGLEILPRIYHKGISQREGVNRQDIRYRYTARRQKTKKGYKMIIQARIPKGKKGAGRYVRTKKTKK